ncbi:MAG: hypothetical protein GYA24_18895, partial [Candidatus Lokiarchaeota archaeon]|nr:hypothetical protein [Candidatus Lokiarchaeota archaeon]
LDFTRGFLGGEFRNIKEALDRVDPSTVDAIILSPGEAKQHYDMLCRKRMPVIIKCDWSNRLLDDRSAYPAQKFRQVPACGVTDALRLGASAAIVDVVFGTPDDDTVKGMRWLRELVQDGIDDGLPVIASILPLGPRVTPDNFGDVANLGTRMCLELGATAAAVPVVTGDAARKIVAASMGCPLFASGAALPGNNGDEARSSIQAMKDAGIRGRIVDGFDPREWVDAAKRA